MKRFLSYNQKLKQRASQMRKYMTRAERKLWFEFLKELSLGRRSKGIEQNIEKFPLIKGDVTKGQGDYGKIKVYRQRIIGNFIVDFYLPDLKLVIEIDGESHFTDEAKIYDEERTNFLQGEGCKILRFTNIEVYDEFEGVCETVIKQIKLGKNQIQ